MQTKINIRLEEHIIILTKEDIQSDVLYFCSEFYVFHISVYVHLKQHKFPNELIKNKKENKSHLLE